MATYRLDKAQLGRLLSDQESATVFAPTPGANLPQMRAAQGEASADALREPRPAQSPKGLFFPASESVGCYGAKAGETTATLPASLTLAGVRACELRAQTYIDRVLLGGDFADAAYRERREAATVVACDCVDCTDTCACTLMGGKPHATEGFDANVTALDDCFLVDVATPKGEAWLVGLGDETPPEATADDLARRDAARDAMTKRVEEQNAAFGFAASDEAQPALPDDADDAWRQFSADCVECGACTHICPTCHCFYLYDQLLGPENFERLRTWDSCLLSTYHRMAGGAQMKLSPRPRLSSRLANRVLHKITYSPQQYELLGCVGCGRCIDACPGAIDIREVVKELSA